MISEWEFNCLFGWMGNNPTWEKEFKCLQEVWDELKQYRELYGKLP